MSAKEPLNGPGGDASICATRQPARRLVSSLSSSSLALVQFDLSVLALVRFVTFGFSSFCHKRMRCAQSLEVLQSARSGCGFRL
jgi:hypothetical protein